MKPCSDWFWKSTLIVTDDDDDSDDEIEEIDVHYAIMLIVTFSF